MSSRSVPLPLRQLLMTMYSPLPLARRSFHTTANLWNPLAGRNAREATVQMSIGDDLYRYIGAREHLKPATALVLLEDILERHQSRLTHPKASTSEVKAILALSQFYVEDLLRARRPIAATQLLRNLAAALRGRIQTRESYAEARLVIVLENLYRALRDFGGEAMERWKVIDEANKLVSKLTPNDWEPDAPRSLRMQRAQILQYYNAEENMLCDDPSTRQLALDRLITNQEKVLQLESGIKSQRSDTTRLRSLRAICSLKEEKGRGEDYRAYAQEYRTLIRDKYSRALERGLDTTTTHEYLTSFVIMCQAQVRVNRWEDALVTASEGLEEAQQIDWPKGFGSQVERCQLYVHRSRCYLKLKNPSEALSDARNAVAMADAIPWNDVHPDPETARDHPNAYRKEQWRCFALINFADTVYDSQVQSPEEQYGLIAADKGLSIVGGKEGRDYFESEFRARKIRALRKLKQWNQALAECRDLSRNLTQLLQAGKRVHEVIPQMVEVYEDAALCFEGMGRKEMSEQLFDEADALEELIDKELPLESYLMKVNDLEATFRTMYDSVASPKVQALGYLNQISGWLKGDRTTSIVNPQE